MDVKTNLEQKAKALTAKNLGGTSDATTQPPATPDLRMVYSLLIKGHLRAKANSRQ
jgi:hypothetical protein